MAQLSVWYRLEKLYLVSDSGNYFRLLIFRQIRGFWSSSAAAVSLGFGLLVIAAPFIFPSALPSSYRRDAKTRLLQ